MTPPTERCPTCDRDGCPRLRYWHTPMNQHPDDITGCLACSAMRDCEAHRVDWRARAIAAESAAAQWAKVAPLIERLREARDAIDLGVGGRDRFCVAALAILAATEATP